jgi:hypothetical protein
MKVVLLVNTAAAEMLAKKSAELRICLNTPLIV